MDQHGEHACCAPGRAAGAARRTAPAAAPPGPTDGMVRLDGGAFLMGSEDRHAYPADGEGPVRRVTLDPLSGLT